MKRLYDEDTVARLRRTLEELDPSPARTLALTFLADAARYEDALENVRDVVQRVYRGDVHTGTDACFEIGDMVDEVNDGT